jgi:hypothetical protein
MEVYSEATGFKCYKDIKNEKMCDPDKCPEKNCNFGQWLINGSVDLKENNK